MINYLKLCLIVAITNAISVFVTYSLLQPSKEVVEKAEPVVATAAVAEMPKKEYLICDGVCSGNDDLIQYAREKTKDMDFILTITQESHRNPFSVSVRGEHGLMQWTTDTLPKRDFINSQEFQNPYRQVDRAWEDRQRWIPYPEVINRQQVGYKDRMKRDKYFHIEYK